MGAESSEPLSIWTVGHSTHPIGKFIDILQAHRIRQLIDVRTVPRSRHNPQFNRDQLDGSLAAAGIHYRHLPALGGLRHARHDSVNLGWRNASFRGYADYMQTPEFVTGLQDLIVSAARESTVVMCAESVPSRCHRSLIADALTVRNISAFHILSASGAEPHTLTAFSRIDGSRVTYPGGSTGRTGNLELQFDGSTTLR